MKEILIRAIRIIVFFTFWPIAWYVSRAIDPKRLHHLFIGLCWPVFGYQAIGHGYEWLNYICAETGLMCDGSSQPRPELTAWRYMYGTPICIILSLFMLNKFRMRMMTVRRRLKQHRQNYGQVATASRRCFWWV